MVTFSENSVKIKTVLSWTFFVIFQTSAVYKRETRNYCTETRFHNIFKTTNAMTLTETILENTYKVLQSSWKKTT